MLQEAPEVRHKMSIVWDDVGQRTGFVKTKMRRANTGGCQPGAFVPQRFWPTLIYLPRSLWCCPPFKGRSVSGRAGIRRLALSLVFK